MVRHHRGPAALLRHGRQLRRAFQTLSGRRLVLLLRRAGLPLRRRRPSSSRAWHEVLHGLGEPSVLLGLSRAAWSASPRCSSGISPATCSPDTFSGIYNSPLDMFLFCIVFAIGVAYIAYRGVNGSTAVNIAINIIQISALIVFGVIAIAYRNAHPQGSKGFHLSNGDRGQLPGRPGHDQRRQGQPAAGARRGRQADQERRRHARLPDAGRPGQGRQPAHGRQGRQADRPMRNWPRPSRSTTRTAPTRRTRRVCTTFNYHPTAKSVLGSHKFNYVFVQACVAILILVGFESVTSMGEEAKDPKRHLPWAILLSLTIQGAICYLFEYFAANYLLNSGYTLSNAGASERPDRRHDGARREPGSSAATPPARPSCSSRPHRLPRPHRHDARLPEHRRPRDLRDGPRRGGRRPLRPPPRQEPDAAPLDLDARDPLDLHRHHHRDHLPRRPVDDPAALDKHNIWYSFGIFAPHVYTMDPEHVPDHHAGQQLRDVPALHDDLHRRDRGLPGAPHVQRHSSTWSSRCSASWRTCSACSSTSSGRSRSRA